MAETVRALLVGSLPDEREPLQRQIVAAGLAVFACRGEAELEGLLKQPDTTDMVVCAAHPSLDHALALAGKLKETRPYLPVIVYDRQVREVARIKCLEQGIDEFVPFDEVAETTIFFARLLALRNSDATLADLTATQAGQRGEMYFQLKDDELSNALQFLCMTAREGRLALKFASGRSGAIFIGNATISHAEYEGLKGLPAIAKMLAGGSMEARFFEGRQPGEITNTRPISQVLIEASVLADETAGT